MNSKKIKHGKKTETREKTRDPHSNKKHPGSDSPKVTEGHIHLHQRQDRKTYNSEMQRAVSCIRRTRKEVEYTWLTDAANQHVGYRAYGGCDDTWRTRRWRKCMRRMRKGNKTVKVSIRERSTAHKPFLISYLD